VPWRPSTLHTVRANLDWLATERKAHYIAVLKQNQPLLHVRVKALPWRQVPAGSVTRDTGHGRTETRTLRALVIEVLEQAGYQNSEVSLPTCPTLERGPSPCR
jgi:hypothetical protein